MGGTLPPSFKNLRNLEVFKGHGNCISGTIPSTSFNAMANLTVFDVGRNPITGQFLYFPDCHKLEKYSANFCALTGTIPRNVLANKPKLEHFFFDGNGLTGTLPDFPPKFQIPALKGISFDINALSGKTPASICNLEGHPERFLQNWIGHQHYRVQGRLASRTETVIHRESRSKSIK